MELLDSSKFEMTPEASFFLQPVFTHGLSCSLHLALLLVLSITWACQKAKVGQRESERVGVYNTGVLYYRQAFFCFLAVCAFNFALSVLNYFYWYKNDSSGDIVITVDFVMKTVSWGALCVYLYSRLSSSGEHDFPRFLRIWCWAYSFVFCSCLVIDFVLYRKHVFLPIIYLISDISSAFSGLFLCYVGFSVSKEAKSALLGETLLSGDSRESNNYESYKNTPYLKAGFFSIVTFSWMSPLIAVGNKKTLGLEDLPLLSRHDSVYGTFSSFKKNLESQCSDDQRRVTTLQLAKALTFSTWKGILLSALFAFLYTCASYVGPFLIDILVEYLNGQESFKNEGYVLAMAFLGGKLVECLSQRHWMFRFQQVGIRFQSMLVAMIYSKGLTLSCQSKEGRTSGEIINLMTVDAARVGEFCWYMHDPWMAVLQVTLALIILYRSVGIASLSAFAATVLMMLANLPLASLQEKFQRKLMESKDTRMKFTFEILKNLRILKLQAWEMKFLLRVIEIRKTETGWLKKFLFSAGMTRFLFSSAPTFIAMVTFGTCILYGFKKVNFTYGFKIGR